MFAKAIATFFVFIAAVATIEARSLLHRVSDSIQGQNPSTTESSSSLANGRQGILDVLQTPKSRVKRDTISSAAGNCPVQPDTAVLVDNHLTFLNFSWDEPEPAMPPNQTLEEPKNVTGDWWPGKTENLGAVCPWIYVTNVTSQLGDGSEYYPKYLTQAKCICDVCIKAEDMRCRPLKREIFIYKKIGCDGEIPVLERGVFHISVGCFCHRNEK